MLNIKKDLNGRGIVPKPTLSSDSAGEVEVLTTDGAEYYHNGSTRAKVVTDSHTATLTNKTIDADDNTISDLEVDNLKAGVLNTDDALSGATDSQIPSALAVKTYVDDSSGAVQADVDDLITLSGVVAGSTDLGTFTGTTIPDNSDNKEALQALETGLEAHIADSSDAHAASAISSTPSGNLAATDVQGALNELQTDVDTRLVGAASSTDNHLVRFDGTTGKIGQDGSTAVLSDAGILSGLTGVTSSGTVEATGTLLASSVLREAVTADSSTTGANATVAPTTSIVRLSNASLTSIDMISSPNQGQNVTIINQTGAAISINNDTGGTAANRIFTGTGASLTLADQASILLKYDSTETRWCVVGGTGAGLSSLDTIFQLVGTDVAVWSTGKNASFLGGGTISGTFAANTSAPLHGTVDYKYTNNTNSATSGFDYMASPASAVDPRFRNQEVTLFFPYLYDGASNDIRVVFYDVTNAQEIPSSVYIQAATTVTMFKTNIVIPSTCASIRVGFQTVVANDGKIFEFDDVQLTSDSTVYADIDTLVSSVVARGNGGNSITANVTDITFTEVTDLDNSWSGTVFTSKHNGVIEISGNVKASAGISAQSLDIYKNGAAYAKVYSDSGSNTLFHFEYAGEVAVGDTFSVRATVSCTLSNTAAEHYINIIVKAPNQNIVTAPETFSTDTASLNYANAATYTLSTLTNAPIGTYITFTYAINSNTRTQTTSSNRPTQTDADMNANGILLYTRAYNAASTSGNPAAIAIQIGKNLKGVSLNAYKSALKVTAGSIDFAQVSSDATAKGIRVKAYEESTGILYLDAGLASTTITASNIEFNDNSSQTSAYLTINGSKNPALTGLNINAIATRAVQTSAQSIANTATLVTWDATKTYDTNGALSAGTGVYTCQEAGIYRVTSSLSFASRAYGVNDNVIIHIYKNGAEYSISQTRSQAAATYGSAVSITDSVSLAKGDTVSIYATNGAGSTALVATAGRNYISITKDTLG